MALFTKLKVIRENCGLCATVLGNKMDSINVASNEGKAYLSYLICLPLPVEATLRKYMLTGFQIS